MPRAYRYAVYLAPSGTWQRLGSAWLGRCERSGARLPRSIHDDPRLNSWTEAPRRYGLHATLKAPFCLREGTTARSLDAAVRALAATRRPFRIPLVPRTLRGFLAWCLADDATAHTDIRALADHVVRDLDAYRAAPTPEEIARRRPDRLSPLQQRMLAQWGYPHVFDAFTFHITLTGQLDDTALRHASELLRARSHALPTTMAVDAISVYVQPARDAGFVVARDYGFDGSVHDAAGAAYLDEDAP